jgi:hypothetical protein
MAKYIVKIKDKYLEWSTIVDAPITYGMSLNEFKEHYKEQYGANAMRSLQDRLKRVEKYGTSAIEGMSIENLIAGNRAGEDETELTLADIERDYC